MRALVVYYSRTGTTRTVARTLAERLGADVEEIACRDYAPGFAGFWRAIRHSISRHLIRLPTPTHDPQSYDLVVVAGPVWAGRPAVPVRSLLAQQSAHLPPVAFVLTLGGASAARALDEMATLAGRTPVATLALPERDVRSGAFMAPLATFVETLRRQTTPARPAMLSS